MSSNGGARGILNIKGKPRVLQPWQAYQALKYESQWKPDVDKGWEAFMAEWNEKHPDEKPAKKTDHVLDGVHEGETCYGE